ncbi:MAG: hypothetical protein E7458_08120 [Ruminococcaceae bacterium]|nr:hypothetical protein [Oscillospiraceae bacterium]
MKECVSARLHPLSRFVLGHGITIASLMLGVWCLYARHMALGRPVTAVLYTCWEVYPLLTLMVLSLSVVGALLIDTYARTQK